MNRIFQVTSIFLFLSIIVQVNQYAEELIWNEMFDDNSMGWYEDSTVQVKNSRYEFYNPLGDSASWRTTSLADGTIQTDTYWLDGIDSNGYGLVFRLKDNNNFYFIWLASKGFYIVGKNLNGNVSAIIPWTPCDYIQVNGMNTIKIQMIGPDFRLFINDNEVHPLELHGEDNYLFSDSSFSAGGYGFYVVKGIKAAFDNFKVWEGLPETTNANEMSLEKFAGLFMAMDTGIKAYLPDRIAYEAIGSYTGKVREFYTRKEFQQLIAHFYDGCIQAAGSLENCTSTEIYPEEMKIQISGFTGYLYFYFKWIDDTLTLFKYVEEFPGM